MKNFTLYTPTRIVFGKEVEKKPEGLQKSRELPKY